MLYTSFKQCKFTQILTTSCLNCLSTFISIGGREEREREKGEKGERDFGK